MITVSQKNSWLPLPYRIVEKNTENNAVVTFGIKPAHKTNKIQINAGQFAMLYVFGIGEIPISVSRVSQDDDDMIYHTIRDVGSVSHSLCRLKIGDQIGVRGPFGNAWPSDLLEDKDTLVVAGGVGLAPLRPVLDAIYQKNVRPNCSYLFNGARNPQGMIFRDDLTKWQQSSDIHVFLTVDRPDENWNHHIGVVTDLFGLAEFNPSKTVAFICGPEIMMRFSADKLSSLGVHPSQIYLTMERNMKCAIGHCGHCQFGPDFICKNGPIFTYEKLGTPLTIKEL